MNKRQSGKDAEKFASEYLISLGYLLLEQNYFSRYGEIDLIMRDKDIIVFVEVKYRKNNLYGLPQESITPKKIKTIIKVAKIYLGQNLNQGQYDVRFDVLAITGEKIEHIKNAFYEI